MRRRLLGVLFGILLVPIAGGLRLLYAALRFLARQPQVALILGGGAVVLSTGNPIVEQIPLDRVRLLEHMIWSWGTLVVGVLVLAYGVTSAEVRRAWRSLR